MLHTLNESKKKTNKKDVRYFRKFYKAQLSNSYDLDNEFYLM